MTSRPYLVALTLSLFAGKPALAEVDAGEFYGFSATHAMSLVTATQTIGLAGEVGGIERWYVPLQSTFDSRPVEYRAALRRRSDRALPLRCSDLAEYTLRYVYEPVTDQLVDEVVDAFVSLDAPRLADRVEIDGDVVGWRLRSLGPDGTITEAWFLGRDYAPPRPGGGVATTASYQNGWLRPYVDAVDIEPAPVDIVLDELLSAETPYRLARASYLPRPARCTD